MLEEVKPTRSGSRDTIGCSAASTNCADDSSLFYNQRFPSPDEKYLIISDGRKMEVEILAALMWWCIVMRM